MKYEPMSSNGNFPFPDHNIDPKLKGADWCMQYSKAAYYCFNFVYPKGVFASNGGDYQRNRLYALGKQPITQYKKWSGIDTTTNNTWMSIDWNIRAILSGYRDKVISRLMKNDYDIVATAIDVEAKDQIDKIYNQLKAKLIVRQQMLQKNPQLATHPLISLQSGEPLDLEELEMRVAMGEQFNRAMDAELAIELGFYENRYREVRKQFYEDLFDFGVTGYKEWLGDDNKAKFRRCNPENVIISYCKDQYLRDMVHGAEEIDVPLIELATLTDDKGNALFTEKELQEFAGSIAGQFGNPTAVGIGNANKWLKPIDKFKCKVLDIAFFTYNSTSYRKVSDENGNMDFRKADFGRGKTSDKFMGKRIQYVYKCKWIVGTDKCYDYGMMYDQKRSSANELKGLTTLPYKFIATNFYEMKCQSTMDKLIPYADDYQLTCLKIQNFKNRAIPSGWWIDLDALENIALNKGGKAMEPKALIQMLWETGLMLGRSKDAAGNPMGPNWKPMIPLENSVMSELTGFFQDAQNTIMTIEKILGFNDITQGNPNPKTLVPGYEIANEDTADALYPLAFAEEMLTEQLAADVLCRMQQGIKKGPISGVAPYKGLGVNTLRFLQLDGDISNRDYGIELQKKSTEQEKAWILQNVNQDIANGFLDTSDAILIIETHNAKQAMEILAYKVKKNKAAQQQNQMQLQQQAGQQNAQAAQITAQSQQQMAQQEAQLKLQIAQMQMQTEIQKAQIMAASQERIAAQSNYVKQNLGETTAQAKVVSTAMSGNAEVAKAHVTGLHQQEKQRIANAAPVSESA